MVDLKPTDFEKSVKEIDLSHDTLHETLKSVDKAWYVPPEIIPDAEMASKNEKESCKGRVISEGIFYLVTFEAIFITPYGVSLQLNRCSTGLVRTVKCIYICICIKTRNNQEQVYKEPQGVLSSCV